MKLTPENIEEHILLLVDGELEASAEEEVIAYLEEHPQYKPMLDAYLATQLQPDEAIVFPGKESLFREEPGVVRVIRFAAWQKAAAVAVILVAAVATALLLQRQEPGKSVPVVARQSTPSAIIRPVDTARTNSMVATVVQQQKGIQKPRNNNRLPLPAAVVPHKQEHVIAAIPGKRKEAIITPLATTQETGIAIASAPAPAAMIATTETAIAAIPEQHNPKAWSPIKEETREGINDLVTHFQAIKEEVQAKTQLLKKAANTIVIRFGDKEVSLNK